MNSAHVREVGVQPSKAIRAAFRKYPEDRKLSFTVSTVDLRDTASLKTNIKLNTTKWVPIRRLLPLHIYPTLKIYLPERPTAAVPTAKFTISVPILTAGPKNYLEFIDIHNKLLVEWTSKINT